MGALRVTGKRAPPRGAHISVHFHGGTGFFLPGAPMGRSFSHIRYYYYYYFFFVQIIPNYFFLLIINNVQNVQFILL